MKKEGREWGCRGLKRVYHRMKMSLEYFMEEGGRRGERLRLRKEIHIVSQREDNLVQ
jgi:hypothetical protein